MITKCFGDDVVIALIGKTTFFVIFVIGEAGHCLFFSGTNDVLIISFENCLCLSAFAGGLSGFGDVCKSVSGRTLYF